LYSKEYRFDDFSWLWLRGNLYPIKQSGILGDEAKCITPRGLLRGLLQSIIGLVGLLCHQSIASLTSLLVFEEDIEMGEEVEKYYFDSKKMKSKGIYMCRVEGW